MLKIVHGQFFGGGIQAKKELEWIWRNSIQMCSSFLLQSLPIKPEGSALTGCIWGHKKHLNAVKLQKLVFYGLSWDTEVHFLNLYLFYTGMLILCVFAVCVTAANHQTEWTELNQSNQHFHLPFVLLGGLKDTFEMWMIPKNPPTVRVCTQSTEGNPLKTRLSFYSLRVDQYNRLCIYLVSRVSSQRGRAQLSARWLKTFRITLN